MSVGTVSDVVTRGGAGRVWLVVIAVLLVAGCGVSSEPSRSPAAIPPADVLTEGLEIIERKAYFADRVDWQAVDEDASRLAQSDPSMVEVHRFLDEVLMDLGDRHSQLMTSDSSRLAGDRPTGHMDDEIGYLHLPAIASHDETERAAYRDAGLEVLSRGACGWIVDVRLNEGGTIGPMLAAIAPLLGPGPAVTYVERDGTELAISINDKGGVEAPDGSVFLRGAEPIDANEAEVPVAVLQHFSTASSGEGVVLALRDKAGTRTFGTETRGVPTANDGFDLPDGSTVRLTIAVGTANGRRYEGVIAPDEPVPYPASRRSDLVGDPVYEAARDWLREHPRCN